MKYQLLYLALFAIISIEVRTQDIELLEGSLKLTTTMGVGLPETGTISNNAGILNLDPASGHPVKVDIGHNLEIGNGEVSINGAAKLNLTNPTGDIMSIVTDHSRGGLAILRNGTDVSVYLDDDHAYMGIGIPVLTAATSYAHLEINQEAGKKAISINNTGGNYWDFEVRANNKLGLYYNGILKGEFSHINGEYTDANALPPADGNISKSHIINSEKGRTDHAQINNQINVNKETHLIEELFKRIELLEEKILALEN